MVGVVSQCSHGSEFRALGEAPRQGQANGVLYLSPPAGRRHYSCWLSLSTEPAWFLGAHERIAMPPRMSSKAPTRGTPRRCAGLASLSGDPQCFSRWPSRHSTTPWTTHLQDPAGRRYAYTSDTHSATVSAAVHASASRRPEDGQKYSDAIRRDISMGTWPRIAMLPTAMG